MAMNEPSLKIDKRVEDFAYISTISIAATHGMSHQSVIPGAATVVSAGKQIDEGLHVKQIYHAVLINVGFYLIRTC